MKPETYKFRIIFPLMALVMFVAPAGFAYAITFINPTGTASFADLVCSVTNFISGTILPPVAVLMMLVVGFLFLISGGDPGKSQTAKKAFFFTVIGVFLLILAPGIIALIESIFGATLASSAACGSTVVTGTIVDALVGLVNWFSWLVAVTSVAMGLYGGFLYVTAKDDPVQAKKARQVMAYTIIGIAVSVIAFSIIALVKGFL